MTAFPQRQFTYDSNWLIAKTQNAQVYRGTYEGNRDVAVKRVLQTSEKLVLTELNALLNVDVHENVVRYFCSDRDDNFCYIVMELCDTDLERYIKDDDEQAKDPQKILYGAAKGLAHIHDRKIIHRDLKPSNILLTKRGSEWIAKICDFGISKELPQDQTSQTWTNQGTEAYKAPELFSSGGGSNKQDGKPTSRFSRRTDMYSFGLVVFFVFSKGRHLCGDYPENLTNIKDGNLVNLHKLKDVPTAESLVLWTTAHDPKARPTIAEVLLHPLFWDKLKTLDSLKAETYRTLLGISHLTEREKKKKFFKAASEGDISFVRGWIQLGLSLDEKDPDDYKSTALHKAAKSGHTPIVEDLLKAGATPNDKDKYGDTPLHEAARYGHKEAVDRLIQAGANPNEKNNCGSTPLYIAAGNGHKEAIDRLIQAGANTNEKDNSGWTPLHLAANSGQKEVVDRLIQAGANTNEKNEYGDTPLHRAAFIGYKEVVKALLGGGASTTVQDNDGQTPRDVALRRNKHEIAQILAAHKV